MSNIRRGRSFSLVKAGKNPTTKIEQHEFPFDASDLAAMHGSYARFAQMGGIAGISGALRTNPKTGLFADEVNTNFEKRCEVFGRNTIARRPLKSFWAHCADSLGDPMLIILIIAGCISIVLGSVDHPETGWTEGLAILFAVWLVTFVGAFNNLQKDKEFRRLDESKKENHFNVTRDGKSVSVAQSQVVVGDLVELAAGDEVPADGIFIFGDDPACNEAKMTGESKDIEKDFAHPFLLAGTEVRKGQLAMLVVCVGINTSYGRIMAALDKEPEDTPLQRKLAKIATWVGYFGGGVAILLFLVLVISWIADMVKNEKAFVDEADRLLDFFIITVTIVVVAVPEGLPLAVIISLAYSMQKMVDEEILVRILSACETMGNATAICSDKTGTLTKNEMTVMKGWVAGTYYDNLDEPTPLSVDTLTLLVEGILCNSKAKLDADEHGNPAWVGQQTEIALCKWVVKYKVSIEEERKKYIIHKNYPFDSVKKNSSIIVKVGNKWRRYFKGASEQLFGRCTHVLSTTHDAIDFAPHRKEVNDVIDRMTKTGLRTIAVTYQEFDSIDPDPKDPNKLSDPPEDAPMVFVCVVGIKDPLRPESRDSVRICQRAGIVVRMVTGDHPSTATFIAKECGILTSDRHTVMTGEEFRALLAGSKAEAERAIPNMRVLARSKPEDKEALVRWLKARGHVVAATGDGTNDAPALKEADIGIAMNIVGTAVAKAAAEILILDDNFASIVQAVKWGRSVFDNIRKFVQFQLTVNVVALSISLIGAFSQYENPLKAIQLLWVNLIMDTMAALALGTEIPSMELLNRRPYSKKAPLISRIMWRNIFGQSILQITALCVVLFAGDKIWNIERKSTEHLTLVFNSFVFMQIFNEINSRKVNNEMNVFVNFFNNKIFLGVIFITVVFQIFMVEFFGAFAKTAPLRYDEWLGCVLIGFLSLPWGVVVRSFKVNEDEGFFTQPEGTFEGADFLPTPKAFS